MIDIEKLKKEAEKARIFLENNKLPSSEELSKVKEAFEQFQKTINGSIIENNLSNFPNSTNYELKITEVLNSIASNKDLSQSARSLDNLGKSLASDNMKYKLDEYLKVNDKINSEIEVVKIQNKMIVEISEYMRTQNEYADKEVKALEEQNDILAKQIESNRKSSRNTMIVAILSILLSAFFSYLSYDASYDIYKKEKIENDKDNEELLKVIGNKSVENENMSLLLKEMQLQNKINKNIEYNQIKLIKIIESQNEYLKKKDKK